MTTNTPTERLEDGDPEFEAQMDALYRLAIDPDLQFFLARMIAYQECLRKDIGELRAKVVL